MHWGLRQLWGQRGGLRVLPMTHCERALRPAKVLNTFSLDNDSSGASKLTGPGPGNLPGPFIIMICLLGRGEWLGPSLYPSTGIPTNWLPSCGCSQPPLPTSDSGDHLHSLPCCDKGAESGAGWVRPLVPFTPLCVSKPVPEFTASCWPPGLHRYLIIHPALPPAGVPPGLVPNDYVQIGGDGCCCCFCCL